MKDISEARNLTLLMDFYELTMARGYFDSGYEDKVGVFDMFFRKIPDDGGFAIAAGLAQFCEVIDNLHFDEGDLCYLRSKGCFSEGFLEYLRNFQFHCNIWAVPEGTPIFPGEPIVIVEGPAIEAQLIETLLLVTFNHQSLICTKTNRIVRASEGRAVMEFGSRRAQGYDAAVLGDQFDIYNSPQNMVQIFALNHEFEPFGSLEVRQAINYCIDKQQIIDSVFGGYATELYTNFSPVMSLYYNDELEGAYETDVAKAQELMEQAGYADGFSFTVKVPANYQAHIDTAQIIAQQLQQINITMNIETIEWATWLEDVYTNASYEGTIIGLTGKLDPDDVLGRFESTYARNFYNYSNPTYDQLINDSVTELDEQTRIDNYKQCQQILTDDAVAVYICDPNLVVASRKDLKGYTFYPVTFHDMTKLYYEG